MATSPLAAALKPTVGADQESEALYNEALQQMIQSLDSRKNRLFDPQLLALAQGFAAPTQTGGFFESMGTAAGAVGKAQAEEEKSQREEAAMKLQIAQARREAALKQQAVRAFGGEGGASAVTKGDSSGAGIMVNGVEYTPFKIAQIGIGNPELGKALESMYKLTLESVSVQQGGAYNKINRQYTPFGGKALVERNVPGVGTIKMPEQDAMELDAARTEGNAKKYWSIVDKNSKPMAQPAAAPAAAPAGAAPSPAGAIATGAGASGAVTPPPSLDERTTVASSEAAAAAAKERATKMASSEAERTSLIHNSAQGARGNIAGYNRASEILSDKEVQKHLGIFARGDLTSAIGNLVSEAVKVGNFTVGLPQIEKIVRESGAPQSVINKLSELAQIEAMWQMESRKGLGSGTSVSNMEQMMANRVTPSVSDPYGSYKQKLAFMREKDEFAMRVSREMKRRNMTFDQFEDTPEFDSMFNAYQQRLYEVTGGKTSKGATQPGAITPGSLRNRLNEKR